MSDINPSPVKSAYGIGSGRGASKGGGRGGRGYRSNQSRSGQVHNQKSRPVIHNDSVLDSYEEQEF